MKKLKKSSNKRPVVVFIYGTIASGKFTIAKKLAKGLGYKVFHNHLVIDFARDLFPKGDPRRSFFREDLHFHIVESLAKLKVPTVMTHAFASDFKFKTGTTDPQYVKKTEKIVAGNGGKFYGVHLICDEKELFRRLKLKSRNKYLKLKNVNIMKGLLKKYDHTTPAPLKNNLVIDNTNLSPEKVASIIIKHFKLK